MAKGKAGHKIWYEQKQQEASCPTDASIVKGAFSGGQCLTECPMGVNPKVGSLSCSRDCPNYAGKQNYAVATGNDGAYGTMTHAHDIYCRRNPVTNEEITKNMRKGGKLNG